ncbi:MAG: GAF domain-containing sensor histidine kinase [Polyangiaceae bacterium]|nr:GAF domain-containing sensor histidine kinase [Polyangiaceae bacterium]
MTADQDPQEERLALLSVLQELTVAALDLFDPGRSMELFLERVAERLGCVAALVIDVPERGAPRLLDAAGLSTAARAAPIAEGALEHEPPRLPYPELSRSGVVTWRFTLGAADVEPAVRSCLLLCFDGEPARAALYRGMMRRLAAIFGVALAHRTLYARALDGERERARRLAAEQAARAAAEDAQRRAAFLAEASRRLSGSLNYEATLARVARLPVPLVAPLAWVDMVERQGFGAHGADGGPEPRGSETSLHRAAVVHADPARADLARRLERASPLHEVVPPSVVRVLRSDESAVCPLSGGPPGSDAAILAELGVTRCLSVPLVSRGTTLGVLTVAWGPDDACPASGLCGDGEPERPRRSPAVDQSLLEELGRRAALAIDNARLYDSAQRAIRAREELVAVVSHDLKSPLATAAMNAQLLLRRLPASDDACDLRAPAERIKRAAERMARLIRDLLDQARIDAGHLAITPGPEDVSVLVVDAVEGHRDAAAEKALRLISRVAPGAGRARCDRDRILQVLANLIGNAIKFTRSGGEVAIGAERAGAEVLFHVRDTGPGIAPEDHERIFDRYWQARQTARHGTGLGLSIAKGLVEAHGGRIWVESALGAGATFFFTLPAAAPAAHADVPSPG